jgi:hypothetical protein
VFSTWQRSTADAIDDVTVGQDNGTIGQDATHDMLRLELVTQSSEITEDLRQFAVRRRLVALEQIVEAVQVPRHFILLLARRLSHRRSLIHGAAERVVR